MTASAEVPISARTQTLVYLTSIFTGSQSVIVAVVMPLWALELGASPLMIGVIISARQVLVVTLSIYGGSFLDEFGSRRTIVILGFAGAALWMMFPAMPVVWAAIAIQLISGFVETTSWMGSQALLGTTLQGLPAYAGRFTAAARIGSSTGPILIGLAWDYVGPFAAFGCLAVWAVLGSVAALLLPDDTPAPKPAAEKKEKSEPVDKGRFLPKVSDYTSTFRLLALAPVALVIMNTFFRQAGSGIQNSFYGVWLDQIGFSASIIGLLIGLSNGVSAFAALSIGFLTRFMRGHTLLLIATLVAVVSIAITPLLGTVFSLLVIAICLRGIGQGINFPMMLSISSQAVLPNQQGRVAALRISFNKFGGAIVPLAMGALAEVIGIENSFYAMGVLGVITLCAVGVWVSCSPAFKNDP